MGRVAEALKKAGAAAKKAFVGEVSITGLINKMRGECDFLLLRNPNDFDTWNDLILLCSEREIFFVEGTVDPGIYFKGSRRFSTAGTGRLADGLQPGIWKYQNNWRGYPAFCNFPNNGTARQRYYRDRNDNDQIDPGERQTYSLHALMHLHRVFRQGKSVGASSAGCVVPGRLDNIVLLAKRYRELFPKSYKTRLTGPAIYDITRDANAKRLYEFLYPKLNASRRGAYAE